MTADQAVTSPPAKTELPALAGAWHPLTPAGVARFADASFGRLVVVQLMVALIATVAVCWFVGAAWFPKIRFAINGLPQTGQIYNGKLIQPSNSARVLWDSRLLGFAINPESQPPATLASDLRVEFRDNDLAICSLFGCMKYPYPRGYVIEFNRPEVQPWWEAWEPIISGILALVTAFALLLSWLVLASLYFPVAWVIAFFADRRLTWAGSWRLAAAANMPGALLLSLGILAYGLQAIDLVRFLVLVCLHLVAGWIFLIASPFTLPRVENAPVQARNPFSTTR